MKENKNLKKLTCVISGGINASEIEKKGLRVLTNQKGDFNEILQFLDPGFLEK